jgi:hypothetical protein
LHIAIEIAAGPFGFADLVEVERDRDAVLGDETDDAFVGQRALTEPVGIPSAALQWIIARGPDEERQFFHLGLPDASVEVEQPRYGIAPLRRLRKERGISIKLSKRGGQAGDGLFCRHGADIRT